MQEIVQFAAENGFTISSFDLDGKVHRFDSNGKKNAWYVGYQHFGIKSGEPYYICVLGDWKTGKKIEFKNKKTKLTREDQDIIKTKLAEATAKAEEERRLKQDEAIVKAKALLAEMKPVFISDYFVKKKISDCHGAGTIVNEQCERIIVVPMRDTEGNIWGAQRIMANGDKWFLSGQRTKGTFHVMGDPEDAQVYLVEGFATGATVRQATGKTVFVCFNASNLVEVAKEIRRKWLNKTIIICGDDDIGTDGNPGRTKGEEAARVAVGTAVFPKFKTVNVKTTDFNDLHVTEGLDEVKKQLSTQKEPDAVGYLCLGFDGSSHFFFDMKSNSIKQFHSFTSTELFELMPLEYWETAYGNDKGLIAWNNAKSDLIRASNDMGAFDPFRIRGTGVWFDRGRTVINTGSSTLLCDGVETNMGKIDTHYIYVATKNKMPPIHKSPLTHQECKTLRDACEGLKWRDDKSGIFLAGWIALARIAGALPIRPHVWITGGSGTGKSTLMDRLVRPALGSEASRLYLQGGSTEAGIRQSVKADSLPIIFDEFETTDQSKERIQNLIELLRQAWSQTQGHVVKGSGNGTATHYALSFSALVSSIRIALDNDADRSRFAVLELVPHENDKAHWDSIKKLLKIINEDYGERLFARMAGMIPTILQSYEAASEALAGVVNQRFGQQYGMLIAAWYALLSDIPMPASVAEDTVSDMGFSEEKEDALETDEQECLNTMLTTRLSLLDTSGNRREKTVGEVIKAGNQNEIDALKSYGIIYEAHENAIYIANQHAALKKYIFGQTRWALCWRKSLQRLPDARPSRDRQFGGKRSRCTKIPKKLAILD